MTTEYSEKPETYVQNNPTTNDSDEEQVLGQVITSIMSPTGERVKVAQMDDAMKFAQSETVIIDEATNRRLVRKIDFYICPLLCLLYALQYMDKNSTNYAAVMGLRTDLHMKGTMYSWAASSFYFGYLLFQFPATRFLQKFPVAKCAASFIILWGIILCFHAIPNNYPGFIVLRVILGMLESAVTPAFVIFTSQWYKREEQFLRTAVWYAFTGFGNIWGGVIAYGLAKNGANYSIESWKVLFIVIGLMTIVFGVIVWFHIPDYPTQAWFLTDQEKIYVVERIRSNNQGFGNRTFKWDQFKEALTDVTTWLFAINAICGAIPSGGISNFGSILLSSTFGYDPLESILMNTPTGGVQLVGCILLPYLTKYIPSRVFMGFLSLVISFTGACLLAFAKPARAQLAGLYLVGFAPVGMIMTLSMFASNTAGHTKKLTANSIYLIAFGAGNIVGPQTFRANQAPFYLGAKIGIVVCYAVGMSSMVALYIVYKMENRRRDKAREALGDSYKKVENIEFADLTDKQNPDFRYVL